VDPGFRRDDEIDSGDDEIDSGNDREITGKEYGELA
jgi:hypothetical protein